MSILTNLGLSFRTNQLIKKDSTRQSISYLNAKQVGILFSIQDLEKHNAIKDLISKIELDGKQVETLCYKGKNKENYEFKFDFFTQKDLSIFGDITSEHVIAFAQQKFDYLLNIDFKPNLFSQNILAMSNARCRIGHIQKSRQGLFELMVQAETDKVEQLIKLIYEYMSKIVLE